MTNISVPSHRMEGADFTATSSLKQMKSKRKQKQKRKLQAEIISPRSKQNQLRAPCIYKVTLTGSNRPANKPASCFQNVSLAATPLFSSSTDSLFPRPGHRLLPLRSRHRRAPLYTRISYHPLPVPAGERGHVNPRRGTGRRCHRSRPLRIAH